MEYTMEQRIVISLLSASHSWLRRHWIHILCFAKHTPHYHLNILCLQYQSIGAVLYQSLGYVIKVNVTLFSRPGQS